MANEILNASVKSLITENGTAGADRIGERLGWGADKLIAWLCLPDHGFADGDDLRDVCRDLCDPGHGYTVDWMVGCDARRWPGLRQHEMRELVRSLEADHRVGCLTVTNPNGRQWDPCA